VYADGFGTEEFKLLEVDESILRELLHDGYVYFLFGPSEFMIEYLSVSYNVEVFRSS
jgi:hypothetical protein